MQNSQLLPPVGVRAVLSPGLADHPLRPATRRRLGRLLPHQLPDRKQAALEAPYGFTLASTCGITPSFEGLFPTSRYVPVHYSAVRY